MASVQKVPEFLKLNRLREVRLKSRGQRTLDVALLAVTGNRHKRGARTLLIFPEFGDDFEAIHSGQAEVEQDYVRSEAVILRHCVESIVAHFHNVLQSLEQTG